MIFFRHPKYKYIQNVNTFQRVRLEYYSSDYYFNNKYLEHTFLKDHDLLPNDFKIGLLMNKSLISTHLKTKISV
jgi:hypothetical protein